MPPARGCHLLGARPRGVPGEQGAGVASGETCLGGEHPHPAGTRGWDQPQPPARGGSQGTPHAPQKHQRGCSTRDACGTRRLRGRWDTGTSLPGGLSWLSRGSCIPRPCWSSGGRDPHSWPGHSWPGAGGGAQLAGAGGVGGRLRVGGPAAAGPASLRGAGARARVCGSRICASPCPPGTQAPSGAVGTRRRGKLLTGTPSPPGSRDRACKQGEVLCPPPAPVTR